MFRNVSAVFLAIFLLITVANGQKAEVTISLNEAFFDALLDGMFQNFDPPQFSVAAARPEGELTMPAPSAYSFVTTQVSDLKDQKPACDQTITILREINGVRTAVRFRDGKIYVPLAFSGNYAVPLVGCVEFAGWAESNIDLEFDKDAQRLIGRIRVNTVNLNGTGGIGSALIAKMLQGTIDKKINPIGILTLDQISFAIPVSKSGSLGMKATGVRHEVVNGALNVAIAYQFVKA